MTQSSSEIEPASDAEVTQTERMSSITPRRLARILDDGLQFGKYRVIRLIAIGGMSEIYEAEHIALDKRVALKVMRRDLAENSTARQRFISEGVNAARLRHTNVVDVTDVGEVDELPFLVMALLEGEDLGRIYDRQERIPIEEIVDLLLPVASAVELGHEKGVVHRDLKPDNIFLHREGCRMIPKVLDFGVSRVMTARRITVNASVFGTPHYMSPEQARGGPTDARTDQYSLGVILYEGVTGRLPRDSANPIELLHAVAYDSFRPPSELCDIPPGLEAVILRAMASDPEDRFASMREFAIALLPYASEAAREYWRLELASSVVTHPNTHLPQTARHPSPMPTALARMTRPRERVTTPSRQGDIVVARTTVSRALPPPPPPPRARVITPARIIAHANALHDFEAALALHRKRRARSLLTGAAAGLTVGLLVFGFWFWRQQPESAVATGTQKESSEYFDVAVQASPLNATIVVDGSTVATGQFDRRYRRDGVEHELRVSAPGWTAETVRFRDAPPPRLIRLVQAAPEPFASAATPTTPAQSPASARAWHAQKRVPSARQPSASARGEGLASSGVERTRATVKPRDDGAPSAAPKVAIADDSPAAPPHVAVVDPPRPRVRIVDEFEPKVRVVE